MSCNKKPISIDERAQLGKRLLRIGHLLMNAEQLAARTSTPTSEQYERLSTEATLIMQRLDAIERSTDAPPSPHS